MPKNRNNYGECPIHISVFNAVGLWSVECMVSKDVALLSFGMSTCTNTAVLFRYCVHGTN